MSFVPRPHEIYKHFKGNLYQITAVAEHTETGEQLVVYQALYGEFKTYARPLSLFADRVDREKYPEAAQEFRFELQGPDAGRQREAEPAFVSANREERNADAEISPAAGNAFAETAEILENSEEEEPALDPLLLEYLDADNYEQRMNILTALHDRITDEMITTMAIASDLEIGEGDTEERYSNLKSCLATLRHYECDRLR